MSQATAIAEWINLRDGLRREINDLVTKRDDYIKHELAKGGDSDSFDGEVGAVIRAQWAAKGILY